MPIDNALYDRAGDIWWDENQPLSGMLTAVNPARFGYFRRVLIERLEIDPQGKTVLDVGCGGFLAEEFARLGCVVTGVDPATTSLDTARPCRTHWLDDRLPGRGRGTSSRCVWRVRHRLLLRRA